MRSPQTLDRLLASMEVTVRHLASRGVPNEPKVEAAPADAILVLHIFAGAVTLSMPRRPVRQCPAGTMLLIPAGLEFTLGAAGEGSVRIVAATVVARLCSSFGLLDQAKAPLVEDMNDAAMVREAWDAMLAEASGVRGQFGASALMDALMKTCILTVLRRFVGRPGINIRIVSALLDPRLGRAVADILDNPAGAHTVDSLATRAGLSRSTFARQFAGLLGYPPMEFVAKTRMHYAAGMLRTSKTPIKTIAAQIGFSSRSHFSRTFRESYGVDPQAFRKEVMLEEA